MSYTIMVIDDEQMILDMLRDQFEMEQYQVITAKSSEEALQKLNQQPDIILLDINMPGMDGLELCRAIRDHVACPILFLTARIEEADRVAGLRAGGDDYILKPFSRPPAQREPYPAKNQCPGLWRHCGGLRRKDCLAKWPAHRTFQGGI